MEALASGRGGTLRSSLAMAAFKSFPLYLGKNGIWCFGLVISSKNKGRNFLSCKQSRHQHVKKISLMQVAHFIKNFTGTEDTRGASAPLPPPAPRARAYGGASE